MDRWHIPFHIIEREWTDDQFFMMIEKMGERLKRENDASKKANKSSASPSAGSGNVHTRSLNLQEAQALGAQKRRP